MPLPQNQLLNADAQSITSQSADFIAPAPGLLGKGVVANETRYTCRGSGLFIDEQLYC
jgi:hypothetical protein